MHSLTIILYHVSDNVVKFCIFSLNILESLGTSWKVRVVAMNMKFYNIDEDAVYFRVCGNLLSIDVDFAYFSHT